MATKTERTAGVTSADLGQTGLCCLKQISRHLRKSAQDVLFALVIQEHQRLGLDLDFSERPKPRKKEKKTKDPNQTDLLESL